MKQQLRYDSSSNILPCEDKFLKLRADFPALKQKIFGKDLIYFDNAASAQKPLCVIEKLAQMASYNYANIHRGVHFLSDKATSLYEDSRETISKFINADKAQEIVFTKNATEALNLVAQGWAAHHMQRGDEVILSIMEHHANLVPWHMLAQKIGIKLRFIYGTKERPFSLAEFKATFSERTKLVAITHMSNVLGLILPIKEMAAYAHGQDVPILVDGAQACVHHKVDVKDLDVDWYVLTGHKLYGPTGIGVLYGKEQRLEQMEPMQGGGVMISQVSVSGVTFADPPYRFEAGTPPIIEAVAFARAVSYLQEIGQEQAFAYQQSLAHYLKRSLMEIEDLKLLGAESANHGICSFYHEKIHSHDLATFLDHEAIALRSGTHCAQPLLEFLGVNSACRLSLALYNSKSEIDKAIMALKKAISFFVK